MRTRVIATHAGSALLLALAALTTLAPSPSAHGTVRHDFLLVHGQWWDGAKFVARDRVYTVGGELHATYGGAVEDTLDLAGRFVLPAFADAHTHLLSDTTGFARQLRALLATGVLYAQNPNNFASRVAAVRAQLAHPGTLEMRFANGGLTSPGGHPVQIYEPDGAQGSRSRANDAYVEVADRTDLDARWRQLLAGKPDLVKVYLDHSERHTERATDPAFFGRRGLDPRLLPEVVRRAHDARLPVAVHVTSGEDFHAAVAAGADEIAHLPLAPIAAADAAEAARRGITVVTTIVSHRPTDGVADLDRIHRDNVRLLRSAGVALALGTDHPARTVVDEAIELCRIGALDRLTAIQLLTSATARHLFPGRRIGGLAFGDEASFVVLESDPLADLAHLGRVAWSMKQGYRVELPAILPSVADTLAPLLMRGDLAGALALEARLRRERPGAFDYGEPQLNALGYRLLNHGAVPAALAIFRRNAEAFPKSANVYDSLADACLAARDTAAALEAYRSVIEVLPDNPGYPPQVRMGLEQRAKEFIAAHSRRR